MGRPLLAWDLDAGALYISLGDARVARTVEADGNTNVDVDADGGIVGIEVVAFDFPSAIEDAIGWPGFPPEKLPLLRTCFGTPADARRIIPRMTVGTPYQNVTAAT